MAYLSKLVDDWALISKDPSDYKLPQVPIQNRPSLHIKKRSAAGEKVKQNVQLDFLFMLSIRIAFPVHLESLGLLLCLL